MTSGCIRQVYFWIFFFSARLPRRSHAKAGAACSICGRLRSIAPTCAYSRSECHALASKIEIVFWHSGPYVSVVAAVSAAVSLRKCRRHTGRVAVRTRRRESSIRLDEDRRSVSEKARLQDQFGE